MMKILYNSILKLLTTMIHLVSFGLIDLNKKTRKQFRVQLLKVKLNEYTTELKNSYDKLIQITGEKSVHEHRLDKISKELASIVNDLEIARSSGSVNNFNISANAYESKKSMIEEETKIVNAYSKAETVINKNIDSLKIETEKLRGEISVIEAKQKTYESMKMINDTMAEIHLPDGTDNTFNVQEIHNDLDEDMIRETAKTDHIKDFVPEVKHKTFETLADMDKYLKSIK